MYKNSYSTLTVCRFTQYGPQINAESLYFILLFFCLVTEGKQQKCAKLRMDSAVGVFVCVLSWGGGVLLLKGVQCFSFAPLALHYHGSPHEAVSNELPEGRLLLVGFTRAQRSLPRFGSPLWARRPRAPCWQNSRVGWKSGLGALPLKQAPAQWRRGRGRAR